MHEPEGARRVERVRYELKRRTLAVVSVAQLTPHVRSITFGGEELADFVSRGFDDHVKLILGNGGADAIKRDYTPRSFDGAARELTIEFALHGDGPATRWAAQAKPGDPAVLGGPRGSFIVPFDYEWHLLIADATGVPAVSRRLEELPAGARAIVCLQVPSQDRRPFVTQASPEITWAETPAELMDAVRALQLPQGDGYAWCAAEAAQAKALRQLIVQEKGHDPRAIRAAAYWKRGESAHHDTLD